MKTRVVILVAIILSLLVISFVMSCGDDDDDDDDDIADDDDDTAVDDDDDNADDDDDDTAADDDDDDTTGTDYAVQFSTAESYVSCDDSDSLNISGDAITVELWVKVNEYTGGATGEYGSIVMKFDADGDGYRMMIRETDRLQWSVWNGGHPNNCSTDTDPLALNQWFHIAGVFDGANCALYVDGIEVDTAVSPIATIGNTAREDLVIGKHHVFDSFIGVVDAVRISDAVRYTAPFTPEQTFENDYSTAGLWHFDEGSGLVANDESANGNTGVLHDAGWVSGE